MTIPLKTIYRFTAIPIKMAVKFFIGIEELKNVYGNSQDPK
jgi:hypothetical protein